MTTAATPRPVLAQQAAKIARIPKRAERGDPVEASYAAKLEEARQRGEFKVAIAMDDKIITLTVPWSVIGEMSEFALRDYVLGLMQKPAPVSP